MDTEIVSGREESKMKSRITQSAIKQVKQYGFRRFTIEDITKDLGISKKTVYKYFDSKEEIIGNIFDYFLKLYEDNISKLLKNDAKWQEKLLQIANYSSKNDFFDKKLLLETIKYYPEQWDKFKKMKQFVSQHQREFLLEGAANGDLRPGLDVNVLEIILDKIGDALLNFDFLNENDLNISKVADILQQVILFGILAPNQLRGAIKDGN